jgi:hypothetical protein
MSSLPKSLVELEKRLPLLASSQDLVTLGVFPTISLCNRLRRKGIGPSFIQISKRVFKYPRQAVLKFLLGGMGDLEK